jgi:hypothetical protein
MNSPLDLDIAYRAVDVMQIWLGFIAVAVSPDMPEFEPGSTVTVRIASPSGAMLTANAVVEYRKRPPLKPVLLRFDGPDKSDVPIGSEIRFTKDGVRGT